VSRSHACTGAVGTVLIALSGGAAAAERGQLEGAEQDYVLHCRGCHGADGAGVAHRIPAVRGSLAGFMRADDGREFVLRVPGGANSALSDAALAAVLNWMAVTFAGNELAGDTRWFTAAEATAARKRPLLAVRSTRHDIVRRLAASGIVVADDY
jgi:cytochrome c553